MSQQDELVEIRNAVRQLCAKYGENYWLDLDRTNEYPTEFVKELTTSGFLTVLIPEEYGGGGLGLLGMQERATMFGARLTIETAPGQGTRVRIELPKTEGS